MAITLANRGCVNPMVVEEYCDWIDRNVDFSDDESVLASAPFFERLIADQKLVSRVLNRELRHCDTFQSENRYSGQTFYIAEGEKYFIRANVWAPPRAKAALEDWEREMFAYQIPHDHNFSFMTGGYFGSGYETSIYEYDGFSVTGMPKEKVAIEFLETTNLTKGKMMFYRASRDIHTQEPPEELSISINLMYFPKQVDLLQYSFDLSESCIKDPLKLGYGSYETLCNIAAAVGDIQTQRHLADLAQSDDNPGIRSAALRAFVRLAPDDAETLITSAMSDPSFMVRSTAEKIVASANSAAVTA